MNLPFLPPALPPKNIEWPTLIPLVGEANREIIRFDTKLESLGNPALLLSPLQTQEAFISSKIEGTEATLVEVLQFEAAPSAKAEKYNDIEEILNYREALRYGEARLKDHGFSVSLIQEMHKILLRGVRGKDKEPGAFREKQNWIGKKGCSMEEATYLPPYHWDVLPCIRQLTEYYNTTERDALIQIALLHAQFEMIHPFLDGNGRIGRLIIPLFLYDKQVIQRPTFYISSYMEKTRDEYYSLLLGISKENAWEAWIEYFLRAVIEQSKTSSQKVTDIQNLYDQKKQIVSEATSSRYSIQTLDYLFSYPIFSAPHFDGETKIGLSNVARIIKRLESQGMIEIIRRGSGRQPHVYGFRELYNLVAV